MATCNCGDICSCLILGEEGIEVAGDGSPANPYVISTTRSAIEVQGANSATASTLVTGDGSGSDPYVISTDVRMESLLLSDVQGDPDPGDTWVWTGDHWEFGPPPVAPAGSVNVGDGIAGQGSVEDPIRVRTAAQWGNPPLNGLGPDSTIGHPVYADSAGALRAWVPDPLPTSCWRTSYRSSANTVRVPRETWRNLDGMTSTGVRQPAPVNGTYTIARDGLWSLSASIAWGGQTSSASSGWYRLQVVINGVAHQEVSTNKPGQGRTHNSLAVVERLRAGDTVRFRAYHNTTPDDFLQLYAHRGTPGASNRITVAWLGPA